MSEKQSQNKNIYNQTPIDSLEPIVFRYILELDLLFELINQYSVFQDSELDSSKYESVVSKDEISEQRKIVRDTKEELQRKTDIETQMALEFGPIVHGHTDLDASGQNPRQELAQEQTELDLLSGNVPTATINKLVSPVTMPEQVSVNSIFKILEHPGRRIVLTYLLCSDKVISVSQLIDYVFSQMDSEPQDPDLRKKLTEKFTHTHLPKLDSEGYVDYDLERQYISVTDLTPVVKPYLAVALALQKQLNTSDKF